MKFSLIRLSTGQSSARIPQCQCVGERPKRHRSGMDLATGGGRVNGITASPQPFRPCRAPGYRPLAPAGSVVPPFITTTTCSDLRSALRHFSVPTAYRLRLYRQSRCGATQRPHSGLRAQTDLSCSAMNCATIPPSLPRWVHRRCTLQDLRAVHGLRPVKRGSAPTSLPCRGCKVPHRTDWLLARRPQRLCHDASTVGSPLPPATSYRAAWSLPGPDSHRQAHRSLAGHTFTIGLYASVMRRSVKTTSGSRVAQGLAARRHRARVSRRRSARPHLEAQRRAASGRGR